MGAYYKVKWDDFLSDVIDGSLDPRNIPFDYEEEVDIINSCIRVNDLLMKLVEKVNQNSY